MLLDDPIDQMTGNHINKYLSFSLRRKSIFIDDNNKESGLVHELR